MSDSYTLHTTASAIEARIRANRLLELDVDWRDEVVFPYYDGLSIYNVAQTILHLLGAPAVKPLDAAVWGEASPFGDVRRVLLLVTDGLGYQWLREMLAEDPELADIVAELTDARGPLPLTSIAPTTTAVALPTLWSAQTPAQHGLVGTTLLLRQFSLLANMLFFRPASGGMPDGTLAEWGLEPEKLLPEPSLAEALNQVGVPTHLLLAHPLMGTGLSRIMHRGVEHRHTHMGTADVWLRLRDVLRQTAGQRCYVHAYWPVVDMLSHVYGAHAEYIRNEVKVQLRALRDVLRLDAVRDGQTLVMVIADHGHADIHHLIDVGPESDGRAAPLLETLRLTYGGDTRLAHLFLRSGCYDRAVAALRDHFADALAVIDPAAAIEAGLYGPGPVHSELFSRLGDLLVLARQSYRLTDDTRKPKPIMSMHGGLSDREMLVPLLWRRV